MHDGSPGQQTFLFADLAGFTALTEAHGDERAARVAGRFCDRVRARTERAGAELVKTIGDAALIRDRLAGRAIELGLSILEEEDRLGDSLEVRIGMRAGSAVGSGGDWYGAAINVAARVVAVAAAGEVVLTDATAEVAGRMEEVELERLGTRKLKNSPIRCSSSVRADPGHAGACTSWIRSAGWRSPTTNGSARSRTAVGRFTSVRWSAPSASRRIPSATRVFRVETYDPSVSRYPPWVC